MRVPRLNSSQDFVLQQFQLHEAERDVLRQKIMVFNAMASGAGNKDLMDQLLNAWNRLVTLTYGMEVSTAEPLNERTMRQEYEQFRNVFPRFKIDKESGHLQISGLTIPAAPKSK